MLRTAVEWEILDRNPCSAVKLPAVQDTAEQIKFFTPEQTHAFLAFLRQEHTWEVSGHQRVDDTGKPYRVGPYVCGRETPLQIQVLLELAVYTGMRKGEILALTWADIDFDQDTVSITKSVSPVKGKLLIKAPKTKSSRRVVTIPHALTERLEQLRQAQDAYRAQVGDYWQGTEAWIFTQENGRMMHYATPYHTLQTLIGQYNQCRPDAPLPMIPFHGLRHTSATLLISAHQDVKTVSARLGHAQTSTTMDIYTHALRENDRQAANSLEQLLGGEK